jgi:hypothetical protein
MSVRIRRSSHLLRLYHNCPIIYIMLNYYKNKKSRKCNADPAFEISKLSTLRLLPFERFYFLSELRHLLHIL